MKRILIFTLALLLSTFASFAADDTFSDAPQALDTQLVRERRNTLYLYTLQNSGVSLTSTAKIKLWDGTNMAGVTSGLALKVDASATTQPVSAASLPLPTGAATSAKQDTANTSLATIATNTGSAANSYRNITSAATTLVKSGAGVMHVCNINSLGTVASTVTIYDGLDAGGTKIATINSLSIAGPQIYDVSFATGLCIVTTGTAAPDITVSYR